FFQYYRNHRHLHSFPTRRSSDLFADSFANTLRQRANCEESDEFCRFPEVTLNEEQQGVIQHLLLQLSSKTSQNFVIIQGQAGSGDRKSTRLNSSHVEISYAVFCL